MRRVKSTEAGDVGNNPAGDRLIIAGESLPIAPRQVLRAIRPAALGMRDSLMQRLVQRFGEPVYRH